MPLTSSVCGSASELAANQPPSNFNMARYCLQQAADVTPDKAALIVIDDIDAPEPAQVWSFAQIERAVLAVAAALNDAGLKRGDRVLIRLHNTTDYALLFFGAIAGGFVPLPTSSQLTEEEALFLARNSGARCVALAEGLELSQLDRDVLVLDEAAVAAMIARAGQWASGPTRGYADTSAADPAFLIYTSGTTANPKGVLHAQRSAWGRRPMYQGWYGISASDRMLHAGAFNWTYTLGSGLTDPWANGATSIIFTGEKSPEIWPHLIERTKATLFAAVPSLFRQILKYADLHAADLSTFRHGLIAGETPPPGLQDAWMQATGTPLYEALGMSEISTYVSSSPAMPTRDGMVGRPQPGRCVAILPDAEGEEPLPTGETGLIAVHRSDPGLMLGYWNRKDEQAEVMRGNWFIGGDRGLMDEDGYIKHLGRANDVMKALGYRVAPQEVEAALSQHESIAEIACAELKVRADVSVIAAYVVLTDIAKQPDAMSFDATADSIKAYAEEHLAAYKQPREIFFVDALPRTPNGKVKRAELAQAPRISA